MITHSIQHRSILGPTSIKTLHSNIGELDARLDRVELRIATEYLSKSEFATALERVEMHMVRIENKLDKLTS